MAAFFYVFLGGGAGSICRYSIAKMISNTTFPYATMVANIISCIILGFLIGYHQKTGLSDTNRLIFMTGFCGGFSTFSTFSAETFQLFENGNIASAFGNIFLSITICLFCIFIGLKLANSGS